MNTAERHLDQTLQQTKDFQCNLVDIANAELERTLVTQETAAFRTSITPEHTLYAVTLTPLRHDLIRLQLRKSQSDCIAYIESLFSELLHLFHKNCHNNYARYEHRLTRFFSAVEFLDKYHRESVTPHLHACIAIHPDYNETFKKLLALHPNPNLESDIPASEQMTIAFSKLKIQSLALSLESRIASIHITTLNREDLYSYAAYCFKEQTHSLQLKQRELRL